MRKKSFRLKLRARGVALTLVIPLPVMAATATFSNFNFRVSPYEDKTKVVTSATKADSETNWYYRITSRSGLGTISSGKIMYLEPNYSGGGLGIATPATISSETPLNTSLKASYYGSCPPAHTYTLYAKSNDQYSSSLNATISGRFTP